MKAHAAKLLVALAASAALLAWPAGAASQEPDPQPEPERLEVQVNRVVVPNTIRKVIDRGISVNATCNIDCLMVVKVRVSASLASKLGLSSRLLGIKLVEARADRRRWVRVRLGGAARRAFESYGGGGRFQIRVRALP